MAEEDILSTYFDVSLGVDMIPGLTGRFVRVSGLGMELNYETYTEGGADMPHYFYNGVAPQTLVLERGMASITNQFVLWMQAMTYGSMIRLCGWISLCNAAGEVLKRWILTDLYPIKFVGPTLDAEKTEYAVERIELLHNGGI